VSGSIRPIIPLRSPGDFILPISPLDDGGDIHDHIRVDPSAGKITYGGTTVRLPGDKKILTGAQNRCQCAAA
jgi:hypothetical protein